MDQIHPNKIRQFFFLGIILLLLVVIWQQMFFMLGALLGAVALYVLMRKIMFTLIKKKWPRWLAALVLIITSLVLIVMPFAWIVTIMINKVQPYLENPKPIYATLAQIDVYLKQQWKLDIFTEKNTGKAMESITAIVPKLLGSTVVIVTNLGIMYFVLYFMLVKCNNVELWLRKNLPLKRANKEKVLAEIRGTVLSNTIGIPVLAIVQGIVAAIGYSIFGVQEPILWGIITGICSVVPLVGTMIAWVPIDLYLFASGNQTGGIGILLWGLIAIGMSDNIFRFLLQKKLADVHPLITVFGVIIGVNLFGFMGLVFGPLVLSLFSLLVKIYIDEFDTATEVKGG